MASAIGSAEVVSDLLLVKAVLAALAVLLFAYYKVNWDRAKKHLPVHFFFTRWRSAKHAVFLGIAAIGFAAGFFIELIGAQYGLSPNSSRFFSSLFEIGALLGLLYVFFTLAIEDVPSFQHISESARHHPASHSKEAVQKKRLARKRRRKKR